MKTPALATVYLDNERIGLMGDPMPRVSKIVAAGGRHPESVQVLRAHSATDQRGKPVRLEDVIDRTAEPTRPIYLTSKPSGKPAPPPAIPAAGGGRSRQPGSPRPDEPAAEGDP